MKALKTLGKIILGIVVGLVALFALFYVLTIGEYAVAETVAQDASIPHITIEGVTYHAETFGDPANPVVIVLHGGPGGDYKSLLSLQALSDQYFVVFFDQRGAGLSPRVAPEQVTLASAIADLDSIVDYYGHGEQVNLVGHSWGAMLASAYLGQHPEKVDHAVLAEPGFLTTEFAEKWAEETGLRLTPGVLYHFVKTKFESLHVRGPDEHAADDYFAHQMNMYQGSDHPQAGYRCEGGGPPDGESWRFGARGAGRIQQDAVDADGNFDISLIDGVQGFTNKVLFIASECQTVIGVEWQKEQMKFFGHADLAVIPDAGHEMFAENPAASITAVREYLNAPAARATAKPDPSPVQSAAFIDTESGLTANMDVPASLNSGMSVMAGFTWANRSSDGFYALKWFTPLEGFAGDIFRVERDGAELLYRAKLVKRGPPISEDYVWLEAGESVSAEVDLAEGYDLVIPQYGLPKILLMYAWPVAWFAFLIYVIGPTFVRSGGTFPASVFFHWLGNTL